MTPMLALFGIPNALAVTTSTVITSVGEGFDAGGDSALQMLADNADKVLIVFGLVLGITLLMRIMKRAAR
jgi:hypothetical protein